jgi:IclR family acetate operon transcriptional repressor
MSQSSRGKAVNPSLLTPTTRFENRQVTRSARAASVSSHAPYSGLTEKTLDVLEAIAALHCPSMQQIQQRCSLPTTTAHRIMQALLHRGFVMRAGKTRYHLGTSVMAMADGLSLPELLKAAGRLPLEALAKHTRRHAHLGIWEGGMVTYLVKQQYGRTRVHSAEGMQLEAYCSAIGKVLLAGLSPVEQDLYIAEGDFVALTPNTIVDADELRREIAMVHARGWATDLEEIAKGLKCVAVPVWDLSGATIGAISTSAVGSTGSTNPAMLVPFLRETAEAISRDLFPPSQDIEAAPIRRSSRPAQRGVER